MLVAAKFGDPVLGVDIHMVLVPAPPAPPIPTPLPHPFIGVVFDPIGLAMGCLMSAVFGGGGPVLINSMPCGNTGTEVKGVPHFPTPPGISFAPNDIPGNEGVLFMGSMTVNMGGDSIARLTDMVISCNFPINLPTSVCLAVPMGPPVLVGGPPAINFMAAVTQMIRTKWVSDQLHALLKARPGSRLSKVICFFTGHPVDVMTGEVLTSQTDFELPGPMPLAFERNYYSRSTYDGPLGPGWHHPLDASVTDEGWRLALRLDDGRERWHAPMPVGASHWDPIERYTLARAAWGYSLTLPEGRTLSFARVEGRDGFALVRVEDECDNAVRLVYDQGSLAEAVDSGGRRWRFAHDARGRLSAVQVLRADQRWETRARYEYAPDGRLAAVTDGGGFASRYAYRNGVLVQETDRNGLSFYFEYDWEHPEGWCVRTWGDGGLYDHRITYDKNARVTAVEDSRGARTLYFGNADGLVVRTIDALGGEHKLEWDASLRQVAEVDPLGARREWVHDARGNRVLARDPLGAETTWRFDERDRPIERVDPDGARWTQTFDRRGRLTVERDPLGAETRFDHDRQGNLIAVTDAAGRTERSEFDPAGNLSALIDGEARRTTYGHDDLGQLAWICDPSGATTRLDRDVRGLVCEVRRPDDSRVTLSYDGECNPVRLTDGLGRTTRFRYVGRGKLAERLDPADTRVRYEYDTEENLVAVVNEAGERYELECDLLGRVVRERAFDGTRRECRYDRAGRAVELVNGRRQVVRSVFDPVGRLLRRTVPGRGEERFAYDVMGRLVAAAGADVTSRWEADACGRRVREAQGEHVVESSYDPGGLRERLSTSLGAQATFQWDGALDLAAVSTPTSQGPAHRVEFLRDLRGDEAGRRFPGEVQTTFARDVRGRVTEQALVAGDREVMRERLQWAAEDGPTLRIDPVSGPTRYERDRRGALRGAIHADGSTQWRAADATGNVYRSPDGADRRYEPGGVLREAEGQRFEYDADGQLVRRVGPDGRAWRYGWDALGQLREVQRPDGGVVRFGYDVWGRRSFKSLDGARTEYVWDHDDIVHVRHPDGVVEAWISAPGAYTPLGRVVGDRWESLVCDDLGAPIATLDPQGNPRWTGRLDLYGQPSPEAEDIPWRWPGQVADPETGLFYNRFRYYDPAQGRYISHDPLGLLGGLSAYSYVRDPLVWVDPWGWIPAPASLPDEPGIYIITNGNQSYVGSAGIGAQGMNTRISSTGHAKAQGLLGMSGTTVQFVRVDLGTATSASDRNNILRYYEAREYSKQKARRFKMLNSDSVQSARGAKKAQGLISTHNADASKRRTTCK